MNGTWWQGCRCGPTRHAADANRSDAAPRSGVWILRPLLWLLPWVAMSAISACVAYAFASAFTRPSVADTPTSGWTPPPANCQSPSPVTAALADGADVRARFLSTLCEGKPSDPRPDTTNDVRHVQ